MNEILENNIENKKKRSVADLSQSIEALIDGGLLAPGQRLIESDLMRELDATRGAVREALRFLAGDGVVELIPHRGGRIRKIEPKRLAQMLDIFCGMLFSALEIVSSKASTERAVRTGIKTALNDLKNAFSKGSPREKAQAVFSFNISLFSLTGNPYFLEALGRLHVKHYVRHLALDQFVNDQKDYPIIFEQAAKLLLEGRPRESYDVLKSRYDMLGVRLMALA